MDASTKSGINWKKWLTIGATVLAAATVGYFSYRYWYTPQLAETVELTPDELKKGEEKALGSKQDAELAALMTNVEGKPTPVVKYNSRWARAVKKQTDAEAIEKAGGSPGFFGLFATSAKKAPARKTAQELGITLKEGQTDADLYKLDFKLDEDQVRDYVRNSKDVQAITLTDEDKAGVLSFGKQNKVDAEVNHSWTGLRNQAIGVAAVPTAAVGLSGYWAYNKCCSKKDDKPVDQKPAYKKPVDNRRQNTDPNARTPYNTAGDRTNTNTDESKTQVEGGDDTKTNKADKKSGMPGWAIFLIIFAIVAVIGAVVYFVFFTSKDEDEEFDNEL